MLILCKFPNYKNNYIIIQNRKVTDFEIDHYAQYLTLLIKYKIVYTILQIMCRAYIHYMLQLYIIILCYPITVYRSNIVIVKRKRILIKVAPNTKYDIMAYLLSGTGLTNRF